jgi:hypothetical protein
VRHQVEDSPLGKSTPALSHSLREVDAALRDWGEGEFRSAGAHLESALRLLTEGEQQTGISAPRCRAWMQTLLQGTGALAVQMRTVRQTIDRMPDVPVDEVRQAHHQMASVSTALVGELIAAKLTDWRDTYERFLAVYLDYSVRRSARLERFGELFRAMFIDRHPAYPMYRHWYTVTENAPEFPAPPTSEPVPTLSEEQDVVLTPTIAPPLDEDEPDAPRRDAAAAARGGRGRGMWGLLLVGGLLIAIALIIAMTSGRSPSIADIGLTITATEPPTATPPEPSATVPPSQTPLPLAALPSATPQPTAEGAVIIISQTPDASPTPAPPTETPTPTPTFTPSLTPTATLPAEGLQGDQDALALLGRLGPEALGALSELFGPSPDGAFWRLGVGGQAAGAEIVIPLEAAALDLAYGNDAPARVRRTEAQLSLATFDPTLPAEQVFFGLMLIPLDGSPPVGLKVEARTLTQIGLYLRSDGTNTFISQKAVNAVLGRIRLVRDINAGTVTAFWNDEQIGQPMPFVRGDVGVVPALLVRAGGVVVNVGSWRITLR